MPIPQEINETEHFNRWSRTYDRHIGQFFFFDPIHRAICAEIDGLTGDAGPASILDVGCGSGRLLRRLGRRWPDARRVGVDLSEGMLAVARPLTPEAEFFLDSAENFPLPAESIAAAVSTVSFHHWTDQAAGIRNIARMLHPGGVFCLADISLPVRFAPLYRTLSPGGLGKFYRENQRSTPAMLREYFQRAGLRVAAQRRIRVGFVLLTSGVKE